VALRDLAEDIAEVGGDGMVAVSDLQSTRLSPPGAILIPE
jgi:hypothetical protein